MLSFETLPLCLDLFERASPITGGAHLIEIEVQNEKAWVRSEVRTVKHVSCGQSSFSIVVLCTLRTGGGGHGL